MKCSGICYFLEKFAPSRLAEDWDNTGLLLGSGQQEIKKVLVCLDITKTVAKEATEMGVDLVISHHPLIFKPLKRIDADSPKGSIIFSLVRNNIAVYSMHTNYDTAESGLNAALAARLELLDVTGLNNYKQESLYKIVVFVPADSVDKVRDAITAQGAGHIGNYSECTFFVQGTGTFRPLENANPYIGKVNLLEKVDEFRLEAIVPVNNLKEVIDAMLKAHPYEEPAYDVYKLELDSKKYSLGKVGRLSRPMPMEEFINYVKQKLCIDIVRFTGDINAVVSKVAVFCGGFDGDFSGMKIHNPDVLVTGDVKHNVAVDILNDGYNVIDAGHYDTEKIMVQETVRLLTENFKDIEVFAAKSEKRPFEYR